MSDDFDPFADDEPAKPVKTTTRKTTAKKENPVVTEVNSGAEITVTLKGGAGFDAPWTVLRADSPAEMAELLAAEELAAVNEKAWRVAKAYQDNAPAREGGGAAAAPAAARQAAPNNEARHCKHGAMSFKSGISQNTGKAWKGFFCPTPKGTADQCQPEFLR